MRFGSSSPPANQQQQQQQQQGNNMDSSNNNNNPNASLASLVEIENNKQSSSGQSSADSSTTTSSSIATPTPTPTTIATATATSTAQVKQQYAEEKGKPDKISFHLKTSIFTRRVSIDKSKMALGLIKQLAIAFLDDLYFQHQFPPTSYIADYIKRNFSNMDNLSHLYERIILRKYSLQQESFLPFNSVSDIEQDSYISIELSEKQPANHHHHHQPLQVPQTASAASSSSDSSSIIKMAHEFKQETFLLITYCSACSTLIKGVYRQGFQCIQCKRNFCPKCKIKADSSGDTCFLPNQQHSSSTHVNNNSSSPLTNDNQFQHPANVTYQSTTNSTNSSSNISGSSQDVHTNSKPRKSASNLLHFNIANPFKSHQHVQQSQQQQQQQQQQPQSPKQQQTTSGKNEDAGKHHSKQVRGSAGALDPVLQQLSKLRDQVVSPILASNNTGPDQSKQTTNNNLVVAQNTHMSSSYQNLSSTNNLGKADDESSLAKQPLVADDLTGKVSTHSHTVTHQLTNSARTSAQNLYARSSSKRENQNHYFISMDWIQLSDQANCGVCNKSLKTSFPTGIMSSAQPPAMCKSCKLQVHAHCQTLVLADCFTRIAKSSVKAAAQRQDSSEKQQQQQQQQPIDASNSTSQVKGTNSNHSKDNIRLHRLAPSVKHVKRHDKTRPIIEGWLKHTTLSDERARQHYWRLDETDITLYEDDTSTRYFKAIALNKITRVMSAHSLPKRIREDVLLTQAAPSNTNNQSNQHPHNSFNNSAIQTTTKSANTSPKRSPELQAQMNAMFAFELTTGSMFLVQANSEDEAARWLDSLSAITSKQNSSNSAQQASNGDEQAASADNLKTVEPKVVDKLMDSVNNLNLDKDNKVAVKSSGEQKTPPMGFTQKVLQERPQPQHLHQHQHQLHQRPQQARPSGGRSYIDPSRSRLYNRPRKTIKLNPMAIPDHWIVGKYLIECDSVKGYGFAELGSGQFGKVYAAISEWKAEDPTKGLWSGVPVAIKEISKARFDLRQQAKLKNEANILSRLDHPGVIILERVHDMPDKIYIVMEQLEDDMLEMITTSPEKRLSERTTKFLTFQILEALKYLHAQNIAHCDLKPENVLLVETRSQFPQIKLCDFGFAKIIEDNSFRSSLVGTPAYLAPEVVQGKRYNRSVDLWSVGVIVYVSLSGEFPFNDDENIHDQISRANFMYPLPQWANISKEAKNFITSLLRVNCEKRLSASRAQMDDWIQDFQLWCDLSELEVKVGKRWVTDDADFERWSRYAKQHNLQIPKCAIQLHEELFAD